MSEITTLPEVQAALQEQGIPSSVESDVLVIQYPVGSEGQTITIAAVVIDDTIRFSANVAPYNSVAPNGEDDILFGFLDLNTLIAPAAVGICTANEENPQVQVISALQIVSIQAEEVVAQVESIVTVLGQVYEVIQDYQTPAPA